MSGQNAAATPLAALPSDPGLAGQWHLRNPSGIDTNVTAVWPDYTGQGVRIGIIDDGFDLANPDLAGVFGTGGWDARGNDANPAAEAGDRHGTAVAGVIGADANGTGLVGIAHDATLVGFRIGYGAAGTTDQLANQLRKQVGVDVSNNSWGFGGFFTDNFATAAFAPIRDALTFATAEGRDGLGTVFVFAAGNARSAGDNVNHHSIQAAPQVITVGAVDATGKVASFSTPGAALLVSAAGVNIVTTDRVGAEGYASGNVATVSGTSFAAPIVSGVVALMLEANPGLGWRDVQEILALSARQTDTANASWLTNGGGGWNGGGMWFSNDYGFGIVDARAAVRLAETWEGVSTSANLATLRSSNGAGGAIPDGTAAGFAASLALAGGIDVEKVQVTLDIRHTWIGDLRVMLVSPEGTESMLIDRPGRPPGSTTGYGSSADDIRFTVTSNAFWGEGSAGTWALKVVDLMAGDTGQVVSWSLTALGDAARDDDIYVFTDAFAALRAADASRGTIADLAGNDTINAAAVTGRILLDLAAGGGTIGGAALALASGTTIETVHGGDGDDALTGDRFANRLSGGRGNDMLRGGDGDDWLIGGAGDDTLDGGAGFDTAAFAMAWSDAAHAWNGDALVLSLGALGIDRLTGIEHLVFTDVTLRVADLAPVPAAAPPGVAATLLVSAVGPGLGYAVKQGVDTTLTSAQHGVAGATVAVAWDGVEAVSATVTSAWNTMKVATVRDVDGGVVTLANFVEVLVEAGGDGPSTVAATGSKRGSITTGAGDDVVTVTAWSNGPDAGGWGNGFTVSTGAGNDSITVTGWNGWSYASIDAGAGDDRVTGTSGADTIRGGTGNDSLAGGAGRDVFVFRRGDGQDVITDFNQNATDMLRFEGVARAEVGWTTASGGTLVRHGGGDQVFLLGVTSGLDWSDFLFA
ncbi:S8 family serine peptidase [Elioraea sp.]|uniref:S8 family serine peptidase n=1 Tax=Elioraea sp. TaxID=2185103 RepID=UPI0025BFE360|nr:S8 family serine peptidase [Elioraea sp.]